MKRHYMLTIIPAPNGGYYLCDDEGNRDWYATIYQARAAARRFGREAALEL